MDNKPKWMDDEPLIKRAKPQPAEPTPEAVEGTEELASIEGGADTPAEEKRGRGRPKGVKNSPKPEGYVKPAPKPAAPPAKKPIDKAKVTAAAVANAMRFYRQGINEPVEGDDELVARIDKFFQMCVDDGQLPTFEKLCLAVGYTKAEVTAWESGTSRGFSSRTGAIIRQAKLALSAVEADLAMQGQIQPSVYQFRSKNFSGMKDQTETVVTPNTEPVTKDLKELIVAAKLLSAASQGGLYGASYEVKADDKDKD